ncbi:MAG: hypothetical protein WCR50_02880 [Proteiniphilum sp.]|nr:hypothetical protein [Proteiniphilum sp.]
MDNIDNILNNYFEGKALPEEENRLREYFRNNTVLPQHEVYKPMFAAFDKEKQIVSPTFIIPVERNNQRMFSFRRLWISAASIAAIILLVVMFFPFNKNNSSAGDYLVFINGRAVKNPEKAQEYADQMFTQADEIIRTSYKPLVEANAIQTKMDASKIFDDLAHTIDHIESLNQ